MLHQNEASRHGNDVEMFMICKISPHPSLLKRGIEKSLLQGITTGISVES